MCCFVVLLEFTPGEKEKYKINAVCHNVLFNINSRSFDRRLPACSPVFVLADVRCSARKIRIRQEIFFGNLERGNSKT